MKHMKIISAALALGLAISCFCTGCGASSGASESETESETTTEKASGSLKSDYTYRVSPHRLGDMAFYEMVNREKQQDNAPMVIFLHGLNSNKEGIGYWGRAIADAGYTVILPDIIGHGESIPDGSVNFFEMVERTSEGIDDILDYYSGDGEDQDIRFCIGGISMGAMTSFYYAVKGERLPECVVSVIGTPNWGSVLGTEAVYVSSLDGELTGIVDVNERNRLIEQLLENSPDEDLERLSKIPTLMINGDADETIPLSGVRQYLAEMSLYSGDVTSTVCMGRIHELEDDDVQESVDYIIAQMPIESGEAESGTDED